MTEKGIETFLEQIYKEGKIYTRVLVKNSYSDYKKAKNGLEKMKADLKSLGLNIKDIWIRKGVPKEYKFPEDIKINFEKRTIYDEKFFELYKKDLSIKDISSDSSVDFVTIAPTKDLTSDEKDASDMSGDASADVKVLKEEGYLEYEDLTVEEVYSGEALALEMETFDMWRNLSASTEINEKTARDLLLVSIYNFKKIKEYFSSVSSKYNQALNDAVKNQLDLCLEYEKMEQSFNNDKDIQKAMKYFYSADKHFNLFIENLEKAQEWEIAQINK
ncbi:MAG TPA: hypothetical protein PLG34_07840 [Spirochaetota bacterium]|nr:hypothetical protein [Spirochaetota bacterium]HPY87879.1 hypothetical protein [Spirochaetota bacterium]HQB60215.1 hypothetical protein [Spirochaetota bacterium]